MGIIAIIGVTISYAACGDCADDGFRFLMILPGPVNVLNMSGRPGRG